MALKGDTSNVLLADIFQTLAQNGQSGILHLRSARAGSEEMDDHRVLFGKHGVTLYDANAFRKERLAHLLVTAEKVSQERLDAALNEIEGKGADPFSTIKLLVVLDEKKLLSLEEGTKILRSEVREELFDVFAIEKMEFDFDVDPVPDESIPRECYFRPEEIVMEAARRIDEQVLNQRAIGDSDPYLVINPGAKIQGLEDVTERLNGQNTVVEIAESLLIPRFEVARVVRALIESNRVRPATANELIEAARTLDPAKKRARIHRMLQRVLVLLPKDDPRLDEVAEAAIRSGADALAIDILLDRARSQLLAGHPETAYTEVLRARSLDGNHIGVLSMLAELHSVRSESASEIKVLTSLAERCAHAGQWEEAARHAGRIADLYPDSPLLDQAFVLYCQQAGCHEYGAEVLSAAAGRRENETRAALLYNGILLLDPTRQDIRKKLAQRAKRKSQARTAWIVVALLSLPLCGVGVKMLLRRFVEERIAGRLEAAQQMMTGGEWKAAQSALSALVDDGVEGDDRAETDRLLKTVAAKLAEKAAQERSRKVDDVRTELSTIQTDLDDKRFNAAIDGLDALATRIEDPDQVGALKTKRQVVAQSIEQDSLDLLRLEKKFTVPDKDEQLVPVRDRFAHAFSQARLDDYRALVARGEALAAGAPWAELAAEIATNAKRGLDVLERVRPRMQDVEERLARNSELELLSADYEDILAAERSGDFEHVIQGYTRLVREYGTGTLSTYFQQKLAAAQAVKEALDAIDASIAAGDLDAARAKARALIDATVDYPLGKTVGLPLEVDTLPQGAEIEFDGKALGKAPQVLWIREGAASSLSVGSSGFRSEQRSLNVESPPRITVELQRESRFAVNLGSPIDMQPSAAKGAALVGTRGGELRRVDLAGGASTGTYKTGSGSGIAAPPLVTAHHVVIATGEGELIGLDADSLDRRWTAPLHAELAGPPIAPGGGDAALAATSDGGLFEIDCGSGTVHEIAKLGTQLRCGPARIGDTLAVGTVDGEVIAIDRKDGHEVFRTAKGPQPIVGVCAAEPLFVAVSDGGELRGLAGDGSAKWTRSTEAATAAPPAVENGLVLIAAGKKVLVLDAATGDVRFEIEAADWIAATPALAGGRLYAIDRSSVLQAFDFNTRALLYRHQLGAASVAPPLLLPEGVLVVTVDGGVQLFGA